MADHMRSRVAIRMGASPVDAVTPAPHLRGVAPDAITSRQLEALIAYAETGDRRTAAHRLGLELGGFKNLLDPAYAKLGVSGAFQAFTKLGWLIPCGPDETWTSA